MPNEDLDEQWMRRAIEISRRSEGAVEPNPMVGCVLVRNGKVIGEGWHEKFGQHHAEVNAIGNATENVSRATAYVTLEPCSHHGKTPPCCQALIDANVSKVVVAVEDPDPRVAGQGITALRTAGIEVTTGLLNAEAKSVLAPYIKRATTGRPWVIAQWAMTIDGKIATASGDSQWISNERSRSIVHQIRGRVDAIMVGSGTAAADDPMLNARTNDGQNVMRTALRVVLDSTASLSHDSQLAKTTAQYPTLLAVGPDADTAKLEQLKAQGVEVFHSKLANHEGRLDELLQELASRGVTNLLVEGGGGLLGLLNDLNQIDEVHAFIGPKLVGGQGTLPVVGDGLARIADSDSFELTGADAIDDDVYCVWRKTVE